MRNNAPTILIVEDDERIRSLMRTVLAGAGYATLETGNAATAVSMLASHSPDLMVLDLGLPDRDGQELLSEIRAWSSAVSYTHLSFSLCSMANPCSGNPVWK